MIVIIAIVVYKYVAQGVGRYLVGASPARITFYDFLDRLECTELIFLQRERER